MKKVIVLSVLVFGLLYSASAGATHIVNGCFEDSCSITPTDTWRPCPTCEIDVKPILHIIGDPNYKYTFLGRTGDKTFEVKAFIYETRDIISNNIMKLFFEKDAIIPLGDGYKLQMLDLKGNTLIYRLIKP